MIIRQFAHCEHVFWLFLAFLNVIILYMKLTKNEIIQLSELARIKLTNQEIKKYGDQISSILDYVKQLDEVDTSKVKTQSHIKGLSNVFKSDVIDQKDEAKKIINQFPEKAGNLNKVKAVMDK